MKSLQHHLDEYVAARRALGTRLEEPAKSLCQFVRFLARMNARFITVQLALEWSQQSRDVQRATWARKLSMVRQFARWMSVVDSHGMRFRHDACWMSGIAAASRISTATAKSPG